MRYDAGIIVKQYVDVIAEVLIFNEEIEMGEKR